MIHSFWVAAYFHGQTVSFREGKQFFPSRFTPWNFDQPYRDPSQVTGFQQASHYMRPSGHSHWEWCPTMLIRLIAIHLCDFLGWGATVGAVFWMWFFLVVSSVDEISHMPYCKNWCFSWFFSSEDPSNFSQKGIQPFSSSGWILRFLWYFNEPSPFLFGDFLPSHLAKNTRTSKYRSFPQVFRGQTFQAPERHHLSLEWCVSRIVTPNFIVFWLTCFSQLGCRGDSLEKNCPPKNNSLKNRDFS